MPKRMSAILAVVLTASAQPLFAEPTSEELFTGTLAVQRAMEQATLHLRRAEHQKAVAALEEQVSRINGNPEYLRLLRVAYRGYVKDLLAARDLSLAEKYRRRLCIIDGTAATDATLRPTSADAPGSPSVAVAPGATPPASPPSQPKMPAADPGKQPPSPSPSSPSPVSPSPSPTSGTFRGKVEDDPFDLSNQRQETPDHRKRLAQKILADAKAEYERKRYAAARLYFDQAHQLDPDCIAACRDVWAYCKLTYVTDQLNQKMLDASLLPDLEREVQGALKLSPGLAEKK